MIPILNTQWEGYFVANMFHTNEPNVGKHIILIECLDIFVGHVLPPTPQNPTISNQAALIPGLSLLGSKHVSNEKRAPRGCLGYFLGMNSYSNDVDIIFS